MYSSDLNNHYVFDAIALRIVILLCVWAHAYVRTCVCVYVRV